MSSDVLVHVSPHPDDEAVGAPATLLKLRDAGWRVVNVLTTLGRPADRRRRLREAEQAARQGGLELVLAEAALETPVGAAFEEAIVKAVGDLCRSLGGRVLLVAPSPHDGHPRHEAVGRAVVRLIEEAGVAAGWFYGVWSDLPLPTVFVPVSQRRMAQCLELLSCYAGEVARNDYRDLLTGRGRANAVLGSERVFGFGSAKRSSAPYAELLTEVVPVEGRLRAGRPRQLEKSEPLGLATDVELGAWLSAPSARTLCAIGWGHAESKGDGRTDRVT